MHFGPLIRKKIMDKGITTEGIDSAYSDFQFSNFKLKNVHHMPDINPSMTFNANTKQNMVDFSHF